MTAPILSAADAAVAPGSAKHTTTAPAAVRDAALTAPAPQRFVTLRVQGAPFAIPVRAVRDVMRYQPLTLVPLAPAAVAGLLVLRGQLVTALDLRACLGMRPPEDITASLMVIVELRQEWFALLVDTLGEAVSLAPEQVDADVSTLDAGWRAAVSGTLPHSGERLAILDLARLIDPLATKLAA